MKYTYKATLPDGRVVTRSTERIYTHVIAVLGGQTPGWGVAGWAGRPDLADKDVRKYSRWAFDKVISIPVDNPRPEPTAGDLVKLDKQRLLNTRKVLANLETVLEMYRANWGPETVANWENRIKYEQDKIAELEAKLK